VNSCSACCQSSAFWCFNASASITIVSAPGAYSYIPEHGLLTWPDDCYSVLRSYLYNTIGSVLHFPDVYMFSHALRAACDMLQVRVSSVGLQVACFCLSKLYILCVLDMICFREQGPHHFSRQTKTRPRCHPFSCHETAVQCLLMAHRIASLLRAAQR